jgi:hypothetical protein
LLSKFGSRDVLLVQVRAPQACARSLLARGVHGPTTRLAVTLARARATVLVGAPTAREETGEATPNPTTLRRFCVRCLQ